MSRNYLPPYAETLIAGCEMDKTTRVAVAGALLGILKKTVVEVRPPDEEIGGDYLHRWWLQRSREDGCIFLHRLLRDDEDRALHDHPWDFTSIILAGSYREITRHAWEAKDGLFGEEGELYSAGDLNMKKAEDAHRLVKACDGEMWTLVFTGPVRRDWGFHCPNGWKHWRDFLDPNNPMMVGPGCGD